MIPFTLMLLATTSLVRAAEIGSNTKSLVNEFALDDLTNADLSFQPITFIHSRQTGGGGSTSGDLSSAPSLQGNVIESSMQQQQHQQPIGRAQMLEQALAAGKQLADNTKRSGQRKICHPTKPFLCPSEDPQGGECIPIQYLCDGSNDCPGGYDEDPGLCTAAKRPPVEETANFLKTLVNNHGPQYISKLFGPKMKEALEPAGGAEQIAIALSVSKTIEDFGKTLHLMRADINHLRNVLVAVQSMDGAMLKNLGIVRNNELADMKFFLEKLLSTGFLD